VQVLSPPRRRRHTGTVSDGTRSTCTGAPIPAVHPELWSESSVRWHAQTSRSPGPAGRPPRRTAPPAGAIHPGTERFAGAVPAEPEEPAPAADSLSQSAIRFLPHYFTFM